MGAYILKQGNVCIPIRHQGDRWMTKVDDRMLSASALDVLVEVLSASGYTVICFPRGTLQ